MNSITESPGALFYTLKAAEYREKARAAREARLKAALEAAAHEYESRARAANAAADLKAAKGGSGSFGGPGHLR